MSTTEAFKRIEMIDNIKDNISKERLRESVSRLSFYKLYSHLITKQSEKDEKNI